ncbi:arsenite efflux transporter metallochaperone ArsD [Schlesneria paludicola]|uniref:arsenite efflux transporter metallochaperone ArsD n=1 Tax=Schlesneria paludicola TaxID=360056 RepID=UPI00029B20AB|nr:arsenite efflux transporter metallochaperone ArsD [Schlesneria paludicola]
MPSIQVFDKPMCCSTGVCGPQVDPVLPRFAADLDWLRSQGVSVDRFNLAQQADAFVKNAAVQELLTKKGIDCLPLTFVDGQIVAESEYPSREKFIEWTRLPFTVAPFPSLSIVTDTGCCSEPGCC